MTTDFSVMTTPQLISAYNGLVTQAQELGLKSWRPIKSFHDKAVGRERCNALATALAMAGQQEREAEATECAVGDTITMAGETLQVTAVHKDDEPETEPTEEELNARRNAHTVVNGQDAATPKAAPKTKAPKKAASKKAPKKTKATTAAPRPGKPSKFPDDAVMHIITKSNPKRPGTAGWDRYALYREGMSVAEALAAGVRRADLIWDHGKGHIKIK